MKNATGERVQDSFYKKEEAGCWVEEEEAGCWVEEEDDCWMKEEDGCMEMENIPETKRKICMIGIVVGSNNCSPFKLSNFFRLRYIGTDINQEESGSTEESSCCVKK